mgnify:CR=1 FL=1
MSHVAGESHPRPLPFHHSLLKPMGFLGKLDVKLEITLRVKTESYCSCTLKSGVERSKMQTHCQFVSKWWIQIVTALHFKFV